MAAPFEADPIGPDLPPLQPDLVRTGGPLDNAHQTLTHGYVDAGPPINHDPELPSSSQVPAAVPAGPAAEVQATGQVTCQAAQTNYLQQLITLTDPELLEKGVTVGIELLDHLIDSLNAFSPADGSDAARWIKAIDELRSRNRQGRTIVGVVGSTGAGKSSVINAVLDEERLLPTNGMRACTASVTEVAYNNSDDPAQLYRAEIEFITFDDWLKELQGLFGDLIDSNGKIYKESSTSDTDAGRAYAKIKAVYPHLTKEMIEQTDPLQLASSNVLKKVLGTLKNFKATEASNMYSRLQRYVDSQEKTAGVAKSMEYWPLIKVVRIYTKAAALSTGAVIVDLPGVQDSNAARAAVAANYMKQCSGLWIVAPITRAVDDKTAKKLLGDEFKRQLKYDGTYSSVTFICSKTDDISITEAAESLGYDDELREDWARIDSINDTSKQLAVGPINELKVEKAAVCEILNKVENDIEFWEDLRTELNDGRIVYAPSPDVGKKRKRQARPSGSRKNRLSEDNDISDSEGGDNVTSDFDSLSGSDKENGNLDDNVNRMPLTQDEIDAKLARFQVQKRALRRNRNEIDSKLIDTRKEVSRLHKERQEIVAKITSMCIKGRNEYSRGAIKQDFAMGIKELDQETAMEADEANFDPEQDLRDYDKVAESLPVFCVSSRAYQQLRGRLKKDNFVNPGFTTEEDTEIPQLQGHAKRMTEAGRALNSRMLLNDISQLLNSMKLWADNDGTSQLTTNDKNAEQYRLEEHLAQLDKNLQRCINECVHSLKEELADNIFDTFSRTIPLAQAAAIPTAQGWGTMHWGTYKATVSRNGVYSGAKGPRDFNAELWAPIATHLAGGWERAFQRRVPNVLQAFVVKTTRMLDDFHKDAISYAREHFINLSSVGLLDQQLANFKAKASEIPAVVAGIIQEIQRDASRSSGPVIAEDMRPAYQTCAEERGLGSYYRMKGHMHSYLDTARQTIFNHAADTVKDQLKAMCDKICQELWALVLENIFKNLSRDYLSVLGSDDTRTISVLTRTERMLRGELSHMLTQDADKAFKDCIPVAEAPTPDQAEEDRSAGDSLDDYKSAEEQPDGAQFDEDEQSIGAQFDEEEQSIGAQFDEEAQYTAAQSVDSPNPPEEMQASNGWFDMGDSKQESVHNAPVDTP